MLFRGHSRYAALVQPGMLIVPRVSMFSIKGGIDEAFHQIQTLKYHSYTCEILKDEVRQCRFYGLVVSGLL